MSEAGDALHTLAINGTFDCEEGIPVSDAIAQGLMLACDLTSAVPEWWAAFAATLRAERPLDEDMQRYIRDFVEYHPMRSSAARSDATRRGA